MQRMRDAANEFDEGAAPARAAADTRRERRTMAVLAALFALVSGLTAADLAGDLGHGIDLEHAVTEGAVVLLGLVGASWMVVRLRALGRQTRLLGDRADALEADLSASEAALAATREEADRWRTEAGDLIRGLGAAIDLQLDRWGLTAAEKDVALLLLKGLSHKEVADLRGTGEATVRQQSRAIYRKAGLSGRHAQAAVFLGGHRGPRERLARDETPAPGGA
jgi:DNA-binding CsgD family transcriptional regulator